MILKLLEKLGKKYAFVDFYGDVLFWRYYLFYYEDIVDNRWIAKLPNIFIHVYNTDREESGPNLDSPHSHPWNTLGFVVRGQYIELVDEKRERTVKAPGFALLLHTQKHRIIKVKQGTVSIFCHWFKKNFWRVHQEPCKTLCDTCRSEGEACVKSSSVKPLEHYVSFTRSDGDSWRALRFLKVDNNFQGIIDRRKKSLEKLGIKTPGTLREKTQVIKVSYIEKKK